MAILNKEHPITLTADEANAVLAGDKTQHRVPVLTAEQVSVGYEWDFGADGDQAVFYKFAEDGIGIEETLLIECPFGAIGDRLWAQEPSLIHCDWDWYYADNTLVKCKEPFTPNDLHLPWDDEHQEYKGAIGAEYLPRWASRLLLEITDIRIERVQHISEADALAMGVRSMSGHAWGCALDKQRANPTGFKSPARFLLGMLWREWHDKDSWDCNPWVWVIEFKKVDA